MSTSRQVASAAVVAALLGLAAPACTSNSEGPSEPAKKETPAAQHATAASPAPAPAPSHAAGHGIAAVGDHLMVEWKGKTYPTTVLQVVGDDRVKIHYDGFGDNWDEVIGRDRIRGNAPPAAAPAHETVPAAHEPSPAAPQHTEPGYPLTAIKAVPDNCTTPSVILATAPGSVGPSYSWSITRQAFLANQQFHVVAGQPSAPGEVQLSPYEYNGSAYALVATCHDGATCNRVAAMYKAVVRSSNPQLTCGRVNGIGGEPAGTFSWSSSSKENLPDRSDTVGLCARLDACEIATNHDTPGDPFLECQKAPGKFKTSCATRYPCAEVMACLEQ